MTGTEVNERVVIVHGPVSNPVQEALSNSGYVLITSVGDTTVFALGPAAADPFADRRASNGHEAPEKLGPVLLTPEEAAKALSVGRTKVYELLSSGALASIRLGGSRRIPATAVAELVAGLTSTSREEPRPRLFRDRRSDRRWREA